MKFGEHLKSSLIKDYDFYYIAYDDLKHQLKKGLSSNNDVWNKDLEEKFLTMLESELGKVFNFVKLKKAEIQKRMSNTEKAIERVVKDSNGNSGNSSSSSGSSMSQSVREEEFEYLEYELREIIADTHDLAKFTKLNYTGFYKILKKHDKRTGFKLRPIFQARLESKPFFKEDYDETVVKLSKMYDLVRTRGNPVKGDSAAGGKQQNFVRQTTKYWVHPDNVTELKLLILQHLPVLVFNANKEFASDDSAITSIYFDNKNMDLYRGRLQKNEGAEAHRLRWYGGMNSDTIFFERKTHREDWTGESSVKQRFSLKEKYVNPFLKGEYTSSQAFEKARKDGRKSKKELDDLEALAAEIQYTMLKEKLRPVMRSFYHRTAFQLPGDARVRISLDTELTLVREDNFDGVDRTKGNWRRTDIGIDWPFEQLAESDVCRFPYAVLEVKLQTQLGQEPPKWIRDLIGSHLVEAVPKFSKFIHGCATLLPDYVHLIPFWLPQMDVDIRKPKLEGVGIRHLQDAPGNIMDEEEATETSPLVSRNVSFGDGSGSTNSPATNYGTITTQSKIGQFVHRFFKDDREFKVSPDTVFDTAFKAPPGKEICVPVRIEPKVYFANERTFLSWLSICMFLQTIGTTLMNYGSRAALLSSIGFFISAFVTLVYASGMYFYRVKCIRMKKAVDYSDNYGPVGACVLVMASTFLTFFFKYSE